MRRFHLLVSFLQHLPDRQVHSLNFFCTLDSGHPLPPKYVQDLASRKDTEEAFFLVRRGILLKHICYTILRIFKTQISHWEERGGGN